MNRDHQLSYCTVCVNRKLDYNKDTICSLTNQKATFEDECVSFQQDAAFREPNAKLTKAESAEVILAIPTDVYERLRLEQNLIPGLGAGVVAGLIGAMLWGVITVVTEFQIGYMAVAIGAGVGFTIRYFGKGIDTIFGVSGAIIAIVSCLFGNYFSLIGFVANYSNMSYLDAFSMLNYELVVQIMQENFSPMDVLFYGLAAYEGYKFSFRNIAEEDLSKYQSK
jgi:hypothetical protein